MRGKQMFDVRITVVRKASYPDLSARYENPIEHACDVQEGQVFVSVGGEKPAGLCDSAWESMAPFVRELARGGGDFYGGCKASEPPAEKKKPYCPWRSRLPECVKPDCCLTGLSSAIACSSELAPRPTWRRV